MTPVVAMATVAGAAGLLAAVLQGIRGVDIAAPHADDRAVYRRIWGHPALVRWLRTRPPTAPLTGAALLLAAISGVAVTSLLGLVLLMVSTNRGLALADLPLARWARDRATTEAVDVLRSVSMLGGSEVILGLGVVLAVVAARTAPRRGAMAFVAATVLGQFAVVNAIKWLIDRARPDLAQLTGFAGASFPSGHAAAAAATWACAALLVARRRPRWVRALCTGAGVGIAVAVGATRVFLGVHWFTDVVAGLVIGWGWFAMCSVAFGGSALHFGEPLERAEDLAGSP